MSDRSAAIVECQQLSSAFCNYIDSRSFEKLGALFAPDGIFERAGKSVTGPAAIQAEMEKRPPHWATMHCCTNVQIDVVSDDRAEGVTYQLVLMQTNVSGDGPFPMPAGLQSAGKFYDTFVRTPDGWRIAHRRTVSVFRQETA